MNLKNGWKTWCRTFLKASGNFIFIMGLLFLFMGIFGQSNSLPGVAVIVGLMTIPKTEMHLSPLAMSSITISLFVGSGVMAAFSAVNPWISFFVNLLFIILILLFTAEPAEAKPYITFLLCYIFCQMAPVEGKDLFLRLAGLAAGSAVIVILALPSWIRNRNNAHSIKAQVLMVLLKHKGFILRMSAGIAAATLVGMLLQLPKPIWIGIAVMSLTQFDYQVSKQRMKQRLFGTVIGAGLFYLLFECVVPRNYSFLLIMLLGYLGNFPFAKKYKVQQTINAVSALNASLIVLNSPMAIFNRLLCLAFAIMIVFVFYYASNMLKKIPTLSFQEMNLRMKKYLIACSLNTKKT